MRSATLVRAVLVAATLAVWILPRPAGAQELEPRSYSNTPVGLNFLIAGYAYQEGDVVTDPGLPIADAQVTVHITVLAYARAFGLFGKSAKVDVVVPYSWVDGSATFQGQPVTRIIDGFSDPRLRFSVNFYGAPALALPAFLDYRQDPVLGASFQMTMPLGQYDDERLINIGTNRWSFKPELGISKTLGSLTLEVAPSITFYTANDDFFGGTRRTQDPRYAVQGHVIYRFGEPLWGSLDGTYYGGGRTAIDGKENEDEQSNARVGLTLALSVTRHHSIKLYASKAVATRVAATST